MREVILAGRGPSIQFMDWAAFDCPVAACSGGVFAVPHADLLITHDGGKFFPDISDDIEIHTHADAAWERAVTRYEMQDGPDGNFTGEGKLASGMLWMHNLAEQTKPNGRRGGVTFYSLLMAVQVLPFLGFDRIYFAGIDLTQEHLEPVRKVLIGWYPQAKAAGVEWFNLSPLSYLQGVFPDGERLVQL